MFLFLPIISFVCLMMWLYLRWLRVKTYWAEQNVPHMPPHPILGGLTFLQRENPTIYMRRIYNTFRTPYVGTWLFWRPALIINSPEISKKILVKDHLIFRNRFLGSGKTDPIGSLNLFTVNDPLWSFMRPCLTALFTATKLRSLHEFITLKTAELSKRIKNDTYLKEFVDIRERVIEKVTKDFMTYDWYRGLSWSSIFFFPELVDLFRLSFFPKDTTEFIRKIYQKLLDSRGGYDSKTREVKDLVDILMKIKRDADNQNIDISEDVFVAQISIFIFGGFDTTAVSLMYIIYELAFNSEVQERLHQDLLEAKSNIDGKEFDGTTLSEIPYLTAVIKETMRLFPSMGWLDRIASTDYMVDDNLTIPAGTPVYVNAAGMHLDPEFYSEPHKFNPDRYMPENEHNLKAFTWMPFGGGPRGCIGKRFALNIIRYVVSSLLLNFELRPLPDFPRPEDSHIETRGLFLAPDHPLSVNFIPRK